MTRAVLRYVTHRITQHPDTDVTFEAECLSYGCEWTAQPTQDGAAVDIACMGHTGRSGHRGFRRLCTSFAFVVRAEADEQPDAAEGERAPRRDNDDGPSCAPTICGPESATRPVHGMGTLAR